MPEPGHWSAMISSLASQQWERMSFIIRRIVVIRVLVSLHVVIRVQQEKLPTLQVRELGKIIQIGCVYLLWEA
jgi:hypothetical protein